MVSNYDRIFEEITNEANRIGYEKNLQTEPLIELVMEIVDAEDQNRIKPFSINKNVENMITNASRTLKQG